MRMRACMHWQESAKNQWRSDKHTCVQASANGMEWAHWLWLCTVMRMTARARATAHTNTMEHVRTPTATTTTTTTTAVRRSSYASGIHRGFLSCRRHPNVWRMECASMAVRQCGCAWRFTAEKDSHGVTHARAGSFVQCMFIAHANPVTVETTCPARRASERRQVTGSRTQDKPLCSATVGALRFANPSTCLAAWHSFHCISDGQPHAGQTARAGRRASRQV